MHPAPSVILFTTLSGIGFGLLAFLGLGLPLVTGWLAFAFFAVAYLLAVGGLLASTFHLGHPERALKAFSQWQTSWLSREAWAAVGALVVMGGLWRRAGFLRPAHADFGPDRRSTLAGDGLLYLDDLCAAENCSALEHATDTGTICQPVSGRRGASGRRRVSGAYPAGIGRLRADRLLGCGRYPP